jgi:hypothetical protein
MTFVGNVGIQNRLDLKVLEIIGIKSIKDMITTQVYNL